MKTRIYCIDIDGTICTTEGTDYSKAIPIKKRIEQINNLYEEGNKIIYFTARGYVTGTNWQSTTLEQFKKWWVKFNELKFGKPNADIYIDDKSDDPFSWFNEK